MFLRPQPVLPSITIALWRAGGGGATVAARVAGTMKAGAWKLPARLLTNPQFVRWMGRAPSNASPAKITSHDRQLGAMAIREPAVRGEQEQMQRMLSQTSVLPSLAADGAPGQRAGGRWLSGGGGGSVATSKKRRRRIAGARGATKRPPWLPPHTACAFLPDLAHRTSNSAKIDP
jgi:hypothetical protein